MAVTGSPSVYGDKNIKCHDEYGYIHINSVTGGVPGYDYFWTKGKDTLPNPNQKDQTVLYAGNYTLRVTDLNKCIVYKAFTISQPDTGIISFNKTSPTCQKDQDGSISAIVSGGTPYTTGNPYAF